MPHILVVDDDRDIASLLAQFLARHSLRVSTARDGIEMFKLMETARIDLIVLDLMLPGEDGLSLCRRLRAKTTLPVIMLTAVVEDVDRIIGLEIGADDYLTKPFNPRELLARIKAVLRRTAQMPEAPVEIGGDGKSYLFDDWRIDLGKHEVFCKDEQVPFSSGEFAMLLAFVEHPQRVLTREQLLDIARGRSAALFDRSVDIQVMRLRRKLGDDPKNPQFIKTVRSGGYMFTPGVQMTGGEE